MENQRVNGAKNALSSMLFYYIYALKEAGYTDPKQEASEEIGKMISLADEQAHLVSEDAKLHGKLSESVELAVKLLSDMHKYDEESISIIRGVLTLIHESFNKQQAEAE